MLNSFYIAVDGLLAGGEITPGVVILDGDVTVLDGDVTVLGGAFTSAASLFPVLGIATRGLIYSTGEVSTWREVVRLVSTITRVLSLNSYYGEGD